MPPHTEFQHEQLGTQSNMGTPTIWSEIGAYRALSDTPDSDIVPQVSPEGNTTTIIKGGIPRQDLGDMTREIERRYGHDQDLEFHMLTKHQQHRNTVIPTRLSIDRA